MGLLRGSLWNSNVFSKRLGSTFFVVLKTTINLKLNTYVASINNVKQY